MYSHWETVISIRKNTYGMCVRVSVPLLLSVHFISHTERQWSAYNKNMYGMWVRVSVPLQLSVHFITHTNSHTQRQWSAYNKNIHEMWVRVSVPLQLSVHFITHMNSHTERRSPTYNKDTYGIYVRVSVPLQLSVHFITLRFIYFCVSMLCSSAIITVCLYNSFLCIVFSAFLINLSIILCSDHFCKGAMYFLQKY